MSLSAMRLKGGFRLIQTPRLNVTRYRRVATKQASPGQSSNVANPQSSGPESQSVNVSRGREGPSDPADSRSVAEPISSQRGPTSEAHEGEEQTEADSMIKNDPREPNEKKRQNVEKAGKKPMGPEDHQ